MPVSGQKNRGAREDSLQILGSVEPLSKKPPLQNQGFKWWEHVTLVGGIAKGHPDEEDIKNAVEFVKVLIYGEQGVGSLPIQDITGEHIDTDNEYMYYSVEFVK